MKFLLPALITLSFLSTGAAYACDAHHDASHQAPKQTITAKHKAKIHATVAKKADAGKAQTLPQSSKTVSKVTI